MMPKKKPEQVQKSDSGLRSRILMVVLVVALVAFTMWVSGPKPQPDEPEPTLAVARPSGTLTIHPSLFTPTPEPLIEQSPTSGVVIGTAAIVVIILVGTLIVMFRTKD